MDIPLKIHSPAATTNNIERGQSVESLIVVSLKVGEFQAGRALTPEQSKSIAPEVLALANKLKVYDPKGTLIKEIGDMLFQKDGEAIRNAPNT